MVNINNKSIIIPCYNQYGNEHFGHNDKLSYKEGDEVVIFNGPQFDVPVAYRPSALIPKCTVYNPDQNLTKQYDGDEVMLIPLCGNPNNVVAVTDFPNYFLINAGSENYGYCWTRNDAGGGYYEANQGGSHSLDLNTGILTCACSSRATGGGQYNCGGGRCVSWGYSQNLGYYCLRWDPPPRMGWRTYFIDGYLAGWVWVKPRSPITGVRAIIEWSGATGDGQAYYGWADGQACHQWRPRPDYPYKTHECGTVWYALSPGTTERVWKFNMPLGADPDSTMSNFSSAIFKFKMKCGGRYWGDGCSTAYEPYSAGVMRVKLETIRF